MPTKEIPKNVINPFSEAFLEKWQIWKMFRWEAHKFSYKGVISEQMALKHLVDLSDGEEEKAVKIVEQSIRRQWQGFFPLHETTHGNGKSKQSTPKEGEQSITDSFKDEFVRRNGGREQSGDGTNLKAV